MSNGIKLEGFEELKAKLKKNVKLEDVQTVVQHRGSEMQSVAQHVCPRRTGALASSITLEISGNGLTADVEPHMNYAAYVEFGTRYMDAQPYIRPAFMQEGRRFQEDLSKLMK